jgi:hypothetical protein
MKRVLLLPFIILTSLITSAQTYNEDISTNFLYIIYAYNEFGPVSGTGGLDQDSGPYIIPQNELANATRYTPSSVNSKLCHFASLPFMGFKVDLFGVKNSSRLSNVNYNLNIGSSSYVDNCVQNINFSFSGMGDNAEKETTVTYFSPTEPTKCKYLTSVTVHTLYKIDVTNRFNPQYGSLRVSINNKTPSYLSNPSSNYSNENSLCHWEAEDEIKYKYNIQVSMDGLSWYNLNLGLYDYTGPLNIPYETIRAAFGNENFVGKECYVRVRQSFEGSYFIPNYTEFISRPKSFYYFPKLNFKSISTPSPSCPGEDATISCTIGNLPEDQTGDAFNYLYLI